MKITLIATTSMGFESVLAKEIKDLGFQNVTVFDTKVEFEATLPDICKVNLWLRTAGRIYIKMGQFKAVSFDELFEKTASLPWENWISKNDAFPVTKVMSRKSIVYSKSDSQSIVKKAIVKRLMEKHKTNSLPETEAEFPIRIQIEKDIVTLSIDSSGAGLNKRGYRAVSDTAPLKETLAAGLLLLSRWRPDLDALLDPFCGTGTILIEAGLMAKNIAPGLNRAFNSEQWNLLPKHMWDDAKRSAKEAIKHDAKFRILGSDISNKALSIANHNIKLAGLSDIFVQKRDITEIRSRYDKGKIVTNPPYGERLQDIKEAESLYTKMGIVFKEHFPQWSYYVITPNENFEDCFDKKSSKHRKIYNGGIKCWYYQYYN